MNKQFMPLHVTHRGEREGNPWPWMALLLVLIIIVAFAALQHRAEERKLLEELPLMPLAELLEQNPEHAAFKRYGTNIVAAVFIEPDAPQTFRLTLEGVSVEEAVRILQEKYKKGARHEDHP